MLAGFRLRTDMPRAYPHPAATAYAKPGASCTASISDARAANPLGPLFGFSPQTAGADGTVAWGWGLAFSFTGPGSVTVTCTLNGQSATAVGQFTIG